MKIADDIFDKAIRKAIIRRTQIGDDIKNILAEDPVNRLELYCACRDYVEMEDFIEVCEELLEDDEDFEYHCKCGVQCDCDDEDEAESDDDDELLPAPKVQTTHKTVKIDVVHKNDGDDEKVDVKVNAGRNGGEIQELPLNNDQKKKIAALIGQGKFEELAEFLDGCIDDQVEELGDTLDDLGTSLKEIRKELATKNTRIDKEEKRLNALDELFERVRKTFSDD